jgi:hypothetical protein
MKVPSVQVKPKKAAQKLNQLSDVQKRIAVCKDVIANIQAAQINVIKGRGYITGLDVKLEDSEAIQYMLPLIKKKCEVCARGAMMISKIDKFNSCYFLNLNDIDQCDTTDQLDFFDEEQLDLIETAFELTNMGAYEYSGDYYTPYHTQKRAKNQLAVQFGQDFKNPSDRLMAIMQNIIDHNGEFKPEVRYSIVKV